MKTDPTPDPAPSADMGKKKKQKKPSKPKFKGETEGMNGFVFQTSEEVKDPTGFVRTLEALERFSNKNYKTDLSTIFHQPKGTIPVIPRPDKPGDTADAYDKEAFTIKVKYHIAEEKQSLVEMKALWSVVWGQCSTTLISKLLDEKDLTEWKDSGNVVELLQAIKRISMKYTVRTNPEINLHKHLAFFYSYCQREHDDIHKYFELFKLMTDGIKNFGGNLGRHDLYIRRIMEKEKLIQSSSSQDEFAAAYEKLSKDERLAIMNAAESKSLAIAFLMGGRPDQYGELILTLQNQYLLKNDLFPNNLTEAYNLMANFLTNSNSYIEPVQSAQKLNKSVYSLGLSFLQRTAIESSDDESHDSPGSGDESGSSDTVDTIGFCFANLGSSRYKDLDDKYVSLKSTWILLDTQSNCDIFKNKDLLKDVHEKEGERLILKSNGNGDIRTSQVGNISGYGEVWFNEMSMANILSFANVRKKFRITISTGPDDPCPTFCVHKTDGSIMEFKEHSLGLYVFDAASSPSKDKTISEKVTNYSFLSTVAMNENNYSSRDIKRSQQALHLYRRLGRPSTATFLRILDRNLIHNAGVTSSDAKLAFHIYGKDPATLMGKTRRQRPPVVPKLNFVSLPDSILALHKQVTI